MGIWRGKERGNYELSVSMFRVQNLNAQHLLHLSFSIAGDLVTAAQSALCVCVCVCARWVKWVAKVDWASGRKLVSWHFRKCIQMDETFSPHSPSTSSHPLCALLVSLHLQCGLLWGACTRCKLNEACASFSRSHAYFLARTSTEWAAEGAWHQQPLWSGKAVWAFVLHLFSATFAFDMHRLNTATAAKASPSTAASQLQIRRCNLCMIFGTLPSQARTLATPLLVITQNRNKVALVICSDDFVHVREMK